MVRGWKGKGQNVLEKYGNWAVDIEKQEKNRISVAEYVDERSRDLKERGTELEGIKLEVVVKGENLVPLLEELTEEVELKEEKLDEQYKAVTMHIEDLEAAKNEVHALKLQQREKLTEIEVKEREIDLIKVSLEKKLREVEQREKECKSDQNKVQGLKQLLCDKEKEIEEKEKDINEKGKEIHVARGSLDNRLREVEHKEKKCKLEQNETHSLKNRLRKKEKEIEEKEKAIFLTRGSLEKRLREVEQREKKCKFEHNEVQVLKHQLHEKEREINEKEKDIRLKRGSLEKRVREVEQREKKCKLEENEAQGLKYLLHEKEEEIENKKRENDTIQCNLDKRLREVGQKEEELVLLRNEIEEKKREIDLKTENLEKRLRDVVQREKECELNQNKTLDLKQLLCEKEEEIEEKEREFNLKSGYLENRLRDVEQREKEYELNQTIAKDLKHRLCEKEKEIEEKEWVISAAQESLANRLREVVQREKESESYHNKTHDLEQLLCEKEKEIEEKEKEIHVARESLENRLREVEQREKESRSFQNKAHDLTQKLGKKMKEIKEKEMKIKLLQESLEKRSREVEQRENDLGSLQAKLQGFEQLLCEKSKKIEEKEKEIDSLSGSLEKRARDVEHREKEFNSSQEKKSTELVLKEELLNKKREEFIEVVNLAERKFREEEKMGCGFITRLESMIERVKAAVDGRLKNIEFLEAAAHNALIAKFSEAESIQELLEKLFEECEKMQKDSSSSQGDKMDILELKDQHLSDFKKELVKEMKLLDKKTAGQHALGSQLLEALEEMITKRFNEMGSLQPTPTSETSSARSSCSNGELVDERLQELKRREEEFHLHQGERERELELEEKKLRLIMEEFTQEVKHTEEKFYEQEKKLCGLLSRLEWAQSNILDMNNTVRERYKKPCSKEDDFHCNKGCAQKELDQAAAIKSLEMVINTEKELELMAKDVFKVLLLYPDPAELVLNAMQNFRTPRFMTGNMELNMQVRLLILDQLTRMSPNIEDSVKKAALKLANDWKSTMTIVDENPLQVLEFLHLLAAYNLPSHFAKDELLSYVKVVAQHERTPELCCILGLANEMHVLVRDLINQKQFLLASTYVCECELGKVFPQAFVLDQYMNHVANVGKSKREKERHSSELQFKAFFKEMADLRAGIEHIVKHGLESEYSPNIMMERKKQLEHEMADLKNGNASSASTNRQRQERGKRSSQVLEGGPVAHARLHEQDIGDGIPFDCRTWDRKHSTKKRSYDIVEIKHYHISEVDDEPLRFPRGSRKRHKAHPADLCRNNSSYDPHRLRRY